MTTTKENNDLTTRDLIIVCFAFSLGGLALSLTCVAGAMVMVLLR